MCNSEIETAIRTLNNRYISLDSDSAQIATDAVYTEIQEGRLPKNGPCLGSVGKHRLIFPNSCQILTRNGVVNILHISQKESSSPEETES